MKKRTIKYTTILIIILMNYMISFAQIPERFSYQAVVRDATNLLLASQLVGVQITILQGATPVYVERHTPTTNVNALVSVIVGTGSFVSGVPFSTIDWGNGIYYIKADIDPLGATAYTITGTAQLLSMPYAFYAKKAENGFSGDYNDLTNKPVTDGSETKLTAGIKVTITGTGTTTTPYMVNAIAPVSGFQHYIGQLFDNGIIYYIYKAGDGFEHLLITHKNESPAQQWQSGSPSLCSANRSWDGLYNTNLIINSPAKDYVTALGIGWYLPSIDELSLLWQNRFHVNQGLAANGGTLISATSSQNDDYWSSTEWSIQYAWYLSFYDGIITGTNIRNVANLKGQNRRVRAVRHVIAPGAPYQGGVLAYVFQQGDPGYVAGQFHGIIASLSDLSSGAPWGCENTLITGADGIILGTGAQNTVDIEAGCSTVGTAADLCAAYINAETGTGVYSDWYLPSRNELDKLYQYQSDIGGFSGDEYWASSEGTAIAATVQNFTTGAQTATISKSSLERVRAVRSF